MENKPLAPTAIASLVLGILSISLCGLVIPGIVLGIIGKKKAQEGYDAIAANPNLYTGEGMLKAGHITSKVGFFVSIGYIFFWLLYVVYFIWLIKVINM